MKKPANWKDLESHQLVLHIHALNVWNANQPVSDQIHNYHYKNEIEPLVKRKVELHKAWVDRKPCIVMNAHVIQWRYFQNPLNPFEYPFK